MRPPSGGRGRETAPATHIAGILFDKDGTLLDFEATWGPATADVLTTLSGGDAASFADMAASAGFLPDTQGFAAGSAIIAGDTDAFAPAWAKRLGRVYDAAFAAEVNALYRAASLASLIAYADVAPMLEQLRAAGYEIGLATNDSARTATAHLEALGLIGHFSYVCGYDSGFGPKPLPGMVLGFADRLGVPPDEIVLVGDSTHDIHAADRAGAHAIGIVRTPQAATALADVASVTIESLKELPALLEAWTSGKPPAADKAKAP